VEKGMKTEAKFADFVRAQDQVYAQVLRELRAGRKETHWIWFIFPQMAGLGSSAMAQKFGISSKAEAQQFLRQPKLGSRLEECTRLLLQLPNQNIDLIMGFPDNLKFRSSMTLFAAIAPEEPIFKAALDKYFEGIDDPMTLLLLQKGELNSEASC
jgi:uncharacterized protein (DUF1810 family)